MVLDDLINLPINSMVIFAGSALAGMGFAYYRKWSWEALDINFSTYAFGDKHALGRAVTTLGVLLAAAGSLDYLSSMTVNQLLVAGAGIGFMVPNNVEAEKLKQLKKQKEDKEDG